MTTEPIGKCIRDILLILVVTVVVVWGLAFIGAYILAKSGPGTLILIAIVLFAIVYLADWAMKTARKERW